MVLRTRDEPAAVGEKERSSAGTKQRVLQKHRLLVPVVERSRDELGGDDHTDRVGIVLQQLRAEIESEQRGRAALPREVVRAHIGAHLELVRGHRAQGGSWREERAVDDEEVNLFRVDPGLGEERIEAAADDRLCLVTRSLHRLVLRLALEAAQDARRPRRALACAGLFEQALHEGYVIGSKGVPASLLEHQDDLGARHAPLRRRFEQRKVEQVDRAVPPQHERGQDGANRRAEPT
mmetsp:Transcript_10188/g.21672  ORF Transcript_10188/g.21672 Transcript_10188/m.21672 type:complete len:236 (+) Transcript_10188:1321-2028(+)